MMKSLASKFLMKSSIQADIAASSKKSTSDNVSVATTDTQEDSVKGVVVMVNPKTCEDISEEGFAVVVNDKVVTLENTTSTEAEGSKKLLDDLQKPVEEEATIKRDLSSHKEKLFFWKASAVTKETVAEPDKKEKSETVEEATENDKKEVVEDEAFPHKIKVFVDGVAVQTLRLTNAGLEHLKKFLDSVKDMRCNEASEKLSNSWLVEKMTEFFETAKKQGIALVSCPAPAEGAEKEATTQEEAKNESSTD